VVVCGENVGVVLCAAVWSEVVVFGEYGAKLAEWQLDLKFVLWKRHPEPEFLKR
jgi:hypothetical protein